MSLGRKESPSPGWTSPSLGSLSSAEARVRSDNCSLCGRKFGLSLTRHVCQFCSRQVCDRHSLGRRPHPQTQQSERICDLCDRDRVGGHLKTQLQTYIAQLKEVKGRLKADISAQKEVWEGLNSQIAKFSHETESQSQSDRLSILESRISIETSSIGAFTNICKSVKESLACSQAQLDESEAYIKSKLAISQSIRLEIAKLQEEIGEMEAKADEKYKEAGNSVARTSVSSLICPHCNSGLQSQSLPPNRDPALVTLGWNRTLPPSISHKSCSSCALM